MPDGRSVLYQKHMTHHMLPSIGRDWMAACRNAFLIRDPADVLASYVAKRGEVTLADIGLPQQVELFERELDRLGKAPPVIDAADVLADPRGTLSALCAALGPAVLRADARLARGPTVDRRGLGAGLVRQRRALDRICFTSRATAAPAAPGRAAPARRCRPAALREAGGSQACHVRFDRGLSLATGVAGVHLGPSLIHREVRRTKLGTTLDGCPQPHELLFRT